MDIKVILDLLLPRPVLLVVDTELESKSKDVLRGSLWVVEFRRMDSCTQGTCIDV